MNTFGKLLAGLSQAGIDFIVVGGLAVAYCGHVRNTLDVDVLIHAEEENVEGLLGCLEAFGEGHARELSLDDFALKLNAEGLILLKEDSLRPKDQMDVQALHDLQRKQDDDP